METVIHRREPTVLETGWVSHKPFGRVVVLHIYHALTIYHLAQGGTEGHMHTFIIALPLTRCPYHAG